MIPTAIAVAQALVAACEQTGEDPVACIRGVPGVTFKAQHYAMWALLAAYPGLKAYSAARMVTGCDKKQAANFYSTSRNQMIPGRRPGGGGWWTAETYAHVTAVVDAGKPTLAPTQAVSPKAPPSSSAAQNPAPAKPARIIPKIIPKQENSPPPYKAQPYKFGELPPHNPRKLGRVLPPEAEDGMTRRAIERGQNRDFLAEAARNTAAMPVPKGPDDES